MLAAKHNELFELMEAKTKATNGQLDEVAATSGKKSPVEKKLLPRLHFELWYTVVPSERKAGQEDQGGAVGRRSARPHRGAQRYRVT